MIKSLSKRALQWINRYPLVFSVVGIYAYYLFTTLDVFRKSESTHLTLLDFILQYDSLIWMWLVVYVVSRAQAIRQKYETGDTDKRHLLTEVKKSAVATRVLRSVIGHLQDSINNPLAIIGSMTEELRKRNSSDPQVLRQFDQIDESLKRIHNAIKDVEVYESTQLLEQLHKQVST